MFQILKRTSALIAFVILLASSALADPQYPPPRGMLNDFAGVLDQATASRLETLLENFRDRSGVEVSVVTINQADMQGYPIEDYALYLGRQWGVGRDSEKRALLLVVEIDGQDAQGVYHGRTRLEVSRHLEGEIPDGLAGEIIRRLRTNFQAGRFNEAVTEGTQTILATLGQKLGVSVDGLDQSKAYRPPERRQPSGRRGISPVAIAVMIIIFLLVIRGIGGGGRGGGRRYRRRGLGLDWMIWPIIFGSGRGGWGGGLGGSSWGGGSDSGWGGGGGGGGFGGFGGGGDFGGGGASDSW